MTSLIQGAVTHPLHSTPPPARRAEVVARQDALVATAAADVVAAVAEVARVMGADVAAVVLDLSYADVHRITRDVRSSVPRATAAG